MHDETIIVRRRQRLIRSMMDERGILLAEVQHRGGWKDNSTVQSWFPPDDDTQAAVMSVAGLFRLISKEALPLDLLSLLLPVGFALVRVPENVDHDELAEAMMAWLAEKERAHHPASPAGRDIADCEDEKLRSKLVVVTGGRASA